MGNWELFIKEVRTDLGERLTEIFDAAGDSQVNQAAKYATMNGGHRWRGLCAVATSLLFKPEAEIKDLVISGACAVEMVHASSLILDDLPSMDNAAVRRGKPCVHLVFPQWVVDMTPVFLVTRAYKVLLEWPGAFFERRLRATLELTNATGRMISGQEMDITQPDCKDREHQLLNCYNLKTGALWAGAAKTIAILCGANEEESKNLFDVGLNMALYYQFMDDISDATSHAEAIGKSSGMDINKLTSVSLFGIEGARERAFEFQQYALNLLDAYGQDADFLRFLVRGANLIVD